MNSLLDYKLLVPLVLLLGLAPFFPQPHIVEKISEAKYFKVEL